MEASGIRPVRCPAWEPSITLLTSTTCGLGTRRCDPIGTDATLKIQCQSLHWRRGCFLVARAGNEAQPSHLPQNCPICGYLRSLDQSEQLSGQQSVLKAVSSFGFQVSAKPVRRFRVSGFKFRQTQSSAAMLILALPKPETRSLKLHYCVFTPAFRI